MRRTFVGPGTPNHVVKTTSMIDPGVVNSTSYLKKQETDIINNPSGKNQEKKIELSTPTDDKNKTSSTSVKKSLESQKSPESSVTPVVKSGSSSSLSVLSSSVSNSTTISEKEKK
ncbi:MAG: hypothetical protein Terrestrivirus6_18 [Terrestrivirus sp.]|uniref:Uncharacterized protein n=1 Tax=Terrestrivirus sp. TaxID=2487775 RepID=A0A3G4ZNE7_9VIRU|nr:MAG: hypothetical protein Terrestrivirus6_18 [Terrestrivirus sp.]